MIGKKAAKRIQIAQKIVANNRKSNPKGPQGRGRKR